MNKLFAYPCGIYTRGELSVCSTLADPTVPNYSGLNIALKLTGSWPWMLYALGYGSVPHCMFSCQDLQLFSLKPHCSVTRERESVSVEDATAQHCWDGEEGGAATTDGAEQLAREQNCGKGLTTMVQTNHPAGILWSPNTCMQFDPEVFVQDIILPLYTCTMDLK